MIVCDTETAGLFDNKEDAFYKVPLVEIAMTVVDMQSLSIIDSMSCVLKPYSPDLVYEEDATKKTGISMDIIETEGVELPQFFKTVKSFISKYANKYYKKESGATLCGHNFKGFDLPFLENLFAYNNDDLYKYVANVEDTLIWAHYSAVQQEDYTLSMCCDANGIELVGSHRAIQDTESNALLFIEYIKKLRGLFVDNSKEEQERFRDSFQLG